MKLKSFAFGIRTVRSFSVEDKLGAIVDEILYSKDSVFDEVLFPEVRGGLNTKILYDPISQNKFTITPQDFIFEYNVKSSFEKEFGIFINGFNNQILKNVFETFKIKNIQRFGFVINSELENNDIFLNDVSSLIAKENRLSDSLALRYNIITKKPLKIEGMVTEDYDNEIITYDRQNSESGILLSIDYQKFFVPELNVIGDSTTTFDSFSKSSFDSFKTKYLRKNEKGKE